MLSRCPTDPNKLALYQRLRITAAVTTSRNKRERNFRLVKILSTECVKKEC